MNHSLKPFVHFRCGLCQCLYLQDLQAIGVNNLKRKCLNIDWSNILLLMLLTRNIIIDCIPSDTYSEGHIYSVGVLYVSDLSTGPSCYQHVHSKYSYSVLISTYAKQGTKKPLMHLRCTLCYCLYLKVLLSIIVIELELNIAANCCSRFPSRCNPQPLKLLKLLRRVKETRAEVSQRKSALAFM